MTLNPQPAQYHQVSPSLTLHYTDHAASGICRGNLVFVHGSGPGASGWSNFKHNVPTFQHAGYRCIVFDLPGYGLSDKPTNVDHTLNFFVANMMSLLDALALDQVTLVGNSLGGAVAMGAALAYPERIERLILMAPGGIESRETYFATEGIQAMVKYPMGSPEFTRAVLAKLLTLLVYDPEIVDEALIDERWSVLGTQNAHVLATMKIPDLSDRIKDIEAPMLVFWGMDDKFCPADGGWKLLQSARSVQAEILNRCGHWVMTEYPQLFNRRCIQFLDHEQA